VASELDTLRAETQNANEKSASAATQTAAMLSLNLKLQSTASKNHAKQIELEIKTIEAREVKELLAIVQVIPFIRHEVTRGLLNLVTAISPRCVHRGR
jgi:dynactin 1